MGHSNLLVQDAEATPERRLLASVVALAVNDACTIPPRPDSKYMSPGLKMRPESFTAMRFLFDKSVSGLNEYALWLDFDADQFRRKLLALMQDDSPKRLANFDAIDRRHFRINYKLWQAVKNVEEIVEEEQEE